MADRATTPTTGTTEQPRGDGGDAVVRKVYKHDEHFTIIDNAVLRDRRLSFRARGLLAYLLSLPDDWRISVDRIATDETSDEGRDAMRTAMRQLVECGYVRRVRERVEGGKFRTVVYVNERPDDPNPLSTSPTTDNQASVDQASVNRASVDQSSHEGLGTKEQPKAKTKRARPRNPYFDALAAVFPTTTRSQTTLLAKVAHELREAGVDAQDVEARARAAIEEWPDCTPLAVTKHWDQLGARIERSGRRRRATSRTVDNQLGEAFRGSAT